MCFVHTCTKLQAPILVILFSLGFLYKSKVCTLHCLNLPKSTGFPSQYCGQNGTEKTFVNFAVQRMVHNIVRSKNSKEETPPPRIGHWHCDGLWVGHSNDLTTPLLEPWFWATRTIQRLWEWDLRECQKRNWQMANILWSDSLTSFFSFEMWSWLCTFRKYMHSTSRFCTVLEIHSNFD